jgi:16S rRNA (adenine1518-N6/adenine1519-N6)-dimethyltransferase
MHAIEIDRDLAQALERELAPRLTIHAVDALDVDFSTLGEDLRVIGNLPYYISTPLLFHIAECVHAIKDIHVMLQQEVVARMVAPPGASNYGRLSVMLQYRFEMQKLLDVPAHAFHPVPAVDSAVVRLTPLNRCPIPHATRRFLSAWWARHFRSGARRCETRCGNG